MESEYRTGQILTHTWPSLKREIRKRAAQEECTISEWMHRLLVRELRAEDPGGANGAARPAASGGHT